MLPLSSPPDIIIPTTVQTPIAIQKQEAKQDERFVSNICLEQPYLKIFKKRPKLKKPKVGRNQERF